MIINGIEFYNPDINTIPYRNYIKFQKYLILDAGIGNDVLSVIQRAQSIQTHAIEERGEDVQTEAGNLILALYSAMEGISHKSMALACMIMDADISTDESVNAASTRLIEAGITEKELSDYIDTLKKKLMPV